MKETHGITHSSGGPRPPQARDPEAETDERITERAQQAWALLAG
jgi:hypothetical protein